MNPVRFFCVGFGLTLPSIGCQYVSGVHELEIAPASTGAKKGPDWSCLQDALAKAVSGPIAYEGQVRNVPGTQIIRDVTARLCDTADADCEHPLESALAPDGLVRFSIDPTFNGYLELESPGQMQAVVELSRPIGAMRVLPELRMLDARTLGLFAASMDATINQDDGHLLFWVEDCLGKRASGVRVEATGELSPETRNYYVLDQKLPSATMQQTDASGGGGIINLPRDVTTFNAYRADTGQLISKFPARIRPGQVTFVAIEPD